MTYRRSAVNSAIVPAEPNGVSAQYVAFVHCVLRHSDVYPLE